MSTSNQGNVADQARQAGSFGHSTNEIQFATTASIPRAPRHVPPAWAATASKHCGRPQLATSPSIQFHATILKGTSGDVATKRRLTISSRLTRLRCVV